MKILSLTVFFDEIEAEIDPKLFSEPIVSLLLIITILEKVHAWFNGKLRKSGTPVHPGEEIIVSRFMAADFKKWLGE